jgi:N-acetyl-beta-hexosaminidase
MSNSSRQTEQTDEREDGQLVDTGLSVVEPTAVVEDTKSEAVKAQGKDQDVSATGESAQAAVAADREDTSDLVKGQGQPSSSEPVNVEDKPTADSEESRKEIEDEAIQHMAQRAANMKLDAETSANPDTTTTTIEGPELPATPPRLG